MIEYFSFVTLFSQHFNQKFFVKSFPNGILSQTSRTDEHVRVIVQLSIQFGINQSEASIYGSIIIIEEIRLTKVRIVVIAIKL